jgi:ACS family tartrate transporter-like MFS transporter
MGKSSDRLGERKLHTAIPLLLGSIFFALTAFNGQPFGLTMLWLCLTGMTLWAWAPSYWALPTMFLGESAAAVSVGLINSIGNLGGFIGPYMVGSLRAHGVAESTVIWLLSGALALAAILILLLRIPRQERGILS